MTNLTKQNRRALRLLDEWRAERLQLRTIYADMYGNYYAEPGTDGTLAGNRLARYELAERGDTVSDNEMPDRVWIHNDIDNYKAYGYEPVAIKTELYIRAARGDEPDVAAERIAQLEADLAAAEWARCHVDVHPCTARLRI